MDVNNEKKEITKKIIRALKRKFIMSLIPIIIVLVVAASIFGVVNKMKNEMILLFSNAKTSISSFLSDVWKWLTDDYWIDLEEKMDYVVDVKTGITLDRKDSDSGTTDYVDKDGNPVEVEVQQYTIVDKYLKELGEKGISTKALRLLGNADYSFEDLLNGETTEAKENKDKVEKYIAEFIRADIITQQPHRRRGDELVNPNDQNKIDGGVYFYRTTKEEQLEESDFPDGATHVEEKDIPVEDKNYKQMTYMQPDEYRNLVNEINSGASNNIDKIRYSFSIDEESGDLMVAEIKKIETKEAEVPIDAVSRIIDFLNIPNLSRFLQETLNKTTEYEVNIKTIDYKSYIAKYTMPYEFLINLCEITQNPEFVYHIALLARETKIVLAIQDNATIEVEATLEENLEIKTFINYNGPSAEGASETELTPFEKYTTITTTTLTPVLRVEYADTWSFYEEFEFTKNIEGEIVRGEPYYEEYTPTSSDFTYEPAHTENQVIDGGMAGGEITTTVEVPERWVAAEITTKKRTTTETITTTTTYNEGILVKSIEKSKQFLGMLRNKDGLCEINCFEENPGIHFDPLAIKCAKKATFERQGKDVEYRIPNSTEYEAPLDKLLSGLDMLYSILQSNNVGYSKDNVVDKDAAERIEIQDQNMEDGDYESAYVVKMQGLVEHLRYLMSFPDNENYTVKDLGGVEIGDDDDENDEEFPPEIDPNPQPVPGELAELFDGHVPTTREEALRYMVTIQVPITTKSGVKTTTSLTIHKAVAENVKYVLQKAQDAGFKVYQVQGFSWRKVNGTGANKMSQHAYGLAVDINVNENAQIINGRVTCGSFWDPSRSEFSIPRGGTLVASFASIGWGWGGNWRSQKDYMHFSLFNK